eukprot:TRINITY_DN15777_c0_g1_i1.p1 TRINITY_DN15777_c0_g1~~TRINITY_DN15777_c0_g1_i1.p1  ORF type:complete len:239 (+),score=65.90 TRINITY_DN15777_c0_g1_i1:94-717(+)
MSLEERRAQLQRKVEALTGERKFQELLSACREFELEAAAAGAAASAANGPLYDVQLATSLIVNDLENARFLWKRMPADAKRNAETASLWNIGKALWAHKIADVYIALGGYQWSPPIQPLISALADRFRAGVLKLLSRSYSVISKNDCASYLGLPVGEAEALVVEQEKWEVDGDMFKPQPPPPTVLDTSGMQQLQSLSKYAAFLEQQQ